MTQLSIRVRGEVLSSNFDEWKLDLISHIQAVNTELATEAQFAQAQSDVKSFKAAEKALKKAKESAINQASDIQRLFSAIDDVAREVRQVRLSLERQVKKRKSEIKEEFIELGIANIEKYIQLQDPDFRHIDYSDYIDRRHFLNAVKYRSNIRALHGAIDDVCGLIKTQVDKKIAMVKDNVMQIDSLPVAHQALFQDRSELLALDATQLNEIIDTRIAVFEKQASTARNQKDVEQPFRDEADVELNVGTETEAETETETETENRYALTIELLATSAEADDFYRTLRSAYSGDPLVRSFHLEHI